MEKEVTLFITSCGRPELLKKTLLSFVKYNTYPIEEVILCEDSGIKCIVDFVKNIISLKLVSIPTSSASVLDLQTTFDLFDLQYKTAPQFSSISPIDMQNPL